MPSTAGIQLDANHQLQRTPPCAQKPGLGVSGSRSARQIIPSQGQKDSFSDGSPPLMARRRPPLDRVSRLSGRTAEAAVASSLAATVGDLVLVLDLRMLLALQSPSRSQHGDVLEEACTGVPSTNPVHDSRHHLPSPSSQVMQIKTCWCRGLRSSSWPFLVV